MPLHVFFAWQNNETYVIIFLSKVWTIKINFLLLQHVIKQKSIV